MTVLLWYLDCDTLIPLMVISCNHYFDNMLSWHYHAIITTSSGYQGNTIMITWSDNCMMITYNVMRTLHTIMVMYGNHENMIKFSLHDNVILSLSWQDDNVTLIASSEHHYYILIILLDRQKVGDGTAADGANNGSALKFLLILTFLSLLC
jgi:WD40 repeat protein